MSYSATPPVVVGYDGSPTSRAALMVAGGEAARRGRTLLVVHVDEQQLDPADRDEDVLAEAVRLVRPLIPPARVAVRERAGAAATVLCDQAKDAELLVVGRGQLGLLDWVMGSVAIDVSTKAPCPVVVVGDDGEHIAHSGTVVAGVDRDHADEVLEAAFREAELRKAELTVIHSWTPPMWFGPDGVMALEAPQAESAYEHAWLHEVVRPFQEKYPAVAVTEVTREGRPATVLEQYTAAAQLIIVGTRGRGPVTGLLLGSVGQNLVRHAHCPVLVVRGRTGN